ncbi:MAG: hypothetical protein IKB11_05315 [Bacteroidaceae bacterium]|nr:hypothetical protein [Bacteroidaceae bacterium]MBR2416155.1 hypothetical protein [Bacteroidaceae bacterium]
MKEIKLKVLHKNIEQRIQIYTYYTGEARKEIGIPERLAAQMQVSSDDSTQLSDHIGNAIAELGNLISRYFAICSIEELFDQETNSKLYIFTLPMPAFFPETALTRIEKSMESYAVKRVLQQWLLQHRPEEAAIPAAEAQTIALQLRELFALRQKPVIELKDPNSIIDL